MDDSERIKLKFLMQHILPRAGGTYHPSWIHINSSTTERRWKDKSGWIYLSPSLHNNGEKTNNVQYPRLLSELFQQSRIILKIRNVGFHDLWVQKAQAMTTELLGKMKNNKNVVKSTSLPLWKECKPIFSDFPLITQVQDDKDITDLMSEASADLMNETPDDSATTVINKKKKRLA